MSRATIYIYLAFAALVLPLAMLLADWLLTDNVLSLGLAMLIMCAVTCFGCALRTLRDEERVL
jgi:hypothetical protein